MDFTFVLRSGSNENNFSQHTFHQKVVSQLNRTSSLSCGLTIFFNKKRFPVFEPVARPLQLYDFTSV